MLIEQCLILNYFICENMASFSTEHATLVACQKIICNYMQSTNTMHIFPHVDKESISNPSKKLLCHASELKCQ